MKLAHKALVGTTIVGAVLGGAAFGTALTGAASAATSPPSATSTAAPDSSSSDNDSTNGSASTPRDPSKGGHVGANGTVEALLTGETAAKVTAAVVAANPKATIERIENDAEGATYEAHIVQADGSHATVKLDAAFTVTATETGH
jgi:uncharacterized membrane protein YkoI